MKVTISKSNAFGQIIVPPSKSYAHRYLIAAALTNKNVVIENIKFNDDIKATISCLETLGYNLEYLENKVKISKIKNDLKEELIFNCNESGSTLRFLIPIALTTGKKITFIGTKRLIERGILPYEETTHHSFCILWHSPAIPLTHQTNHLL